MKRSLLLILMMSLVGILSVQAQEKFVLMGENNLGVGMSPNGKYIVGVDAKASVLGNYLMSFLYNVESGQQEWLTNYDETDVSKSGEFTDVTDEGIIIGSFRNPDYLITVGGKTFPINVAAVWKDGQVTSLGIGDYNLSEYNNFEDGSFARAISNDGTTVVGNLGLKNTYSFPCMWKFDKIKGEWSYSQLNIPVDAVGGKAYDVSADGSIVVGTIWYDRYEEAAYWMNGECYLIKGTGEDIRYNEGTNRNGASAISPNGKYIAFFFNRFNPAVYNVENQTYMKLDIYPDSKGLNKLSVSNGGNVVSGYSYGHLMLGKIWQRPFWYFYKDHRTFDFDYFMEVFAAGVESPFSFLYEENTQAIPCAISADGTTIMGNNNTVVPLGGVPQPWVLCTNEQNIAIPEALKHVQASSLNLMEVTINWKEEKHTYEGLELQYYRIYCDGQRVVDVSNNEQEDFTYVQRNVTPGFLKYSVARVFKNTDTGDLIESPKSEPMIVTVPGTYSLPFYDDFDSGSTDTNFWTKQLLEGNALECNWNPIIYCGVVDKGLFVSTSSLQPYSSTLTSRPLDASNERKVWVSFAIACRLDEGHDQILDKDFLSVDVTVDKGNSWTEVKSYSLEQLSRGWSFQKIDLSSYVAGKLFQVRLRKHGAGMVSFNYLIDIFKVGINAEKEAPEGLTGALDNKKVKLIWKNSYHAYQMNYLTYDYRGLSLAIGDEANPFIAVNVFDKKELQIYKGKYLTSIKAYVNHDFNIEDSKGTHASVVVFEDGRLVREQEIESIDYNEENIVILKEPVFIDAAHELKIGLKIFDYDARQMPITYQNTIYFVPGKSDLYSQDNGKTWQKLSDFYVTVEGKETNGYCCWEISGGVTDEQNVESDIILGKDLYGYNVYRNGEQLNKEIIHYQNPSFTDVESLKQATYEVLAFYIDGSVSKVSNAYVFGDESGINENKVDCRVIVSPNPATDYIIMDGEFEQATLYSINGQAIETTKESRINLVDLIQGLYLLKIESKSGIENHKIVIKK